MSQPARRLGRGLSSLISLGEIENTSPPPQDASPPETAAATVKVGLIRPNPFQPRRDIPPASLQALASSIAKTGVIQPVSVRKTGKDVYELIVGERRWRAAQMAGLTEIPAVVRDATDEQMLEVAIVENIYREELNAIDRAAAYKRYCDTFQLSVDEVAQRLAEDRTTVTNYLRLLDLPKDVQEFIIEGKLAMGHARALLGLKGATEIIGLARKAVEGGLSVREVERLVRERAAARESATKITQKEAQKRPVIRDLEQAFVRALGTKVDIHESKRKGKGRIVIHYRSLDDFDLVCERLGIATDES